MKRRTILACLTWAATAALAVGAGEAAISVLGAGITDHEVKPMTAGEVERALAQPYTPATPQPTAPTATRTLAVPGPRVTVTRTATTATHSLSSPGGSVVVRCDHETAYLVSWSPAQGFAVGQTKRGPAQEVSVQFIAGPVRFVMAIGCQGGNPVSVGGFNWGGNGHWHVPGLGDLKNQQPDQLNQGGQ